MLLRLPQRQLELVIIITAHGVGFACCNVPAAATSTTYDQKAWRSLTCSHERLSMVCPTFGVATCMSRLRACSRKLRRLHRAYISSGAVPAIAGTSQHLSSNFADLRAKKKKSGLGVKICKSKARPRKNMHIDARFTLSSSLVKSPCKKPAAP